MSLVRWDPWREVEGMFDRYARAVGWPRPGSHEALTTGDWSPQVDVTEDDTHYMIKMEIPGIQREDVKITVEHGLLKIRGERKQEKEDKGKTFHRIERQYGTFVRCFTLPDNVEENSIKAVFKDGLLNLQVKKTGESAPKSIEVKID